MGRTFFAGIPGWFSSSLFRSFRVRLDWIPFSISTSRLSVLSVWYNASDQWSVQTGQYRLLQRDSFWFKFRWKICFRICLLSRVHRFHSHGIWTTHRRQNTTCSLVWTCQQSPVNTSQLWAKHSTLRCYDRPSVTVTSLSLIPTMKRRSQVTLYRTLYCTVHRGAWATVKSAAIYLWVSSNHYWPQLAYFRFRWTVCSKIWTVRYNLGFELYIIPFFLHVLDPVLRKFWST